MINFSELRKIKSLSEAVQNVTEASKGLAANEMSVSFDDRDGFVFIETGLLSQKEPGNIFYGFPDEVSSDGPLSFVKGVIMDPLNFKTVEKMEKAIAKLEKEGLEIDGNEWDAEEQAYLPKSMKIKQVGDSKVFLFKLKPKFANKKVLKYIG